VAKAPTQAEANPGRYRYQDTNNDNQINDDDRTFLGNANPDFTTGINLSIRYKNFDLTAFFYGSFGNEVQNATRFYTDFYLGGGHAKRKALLYDSWTPQNTSASLPIAELNNTFSTGAFNSFNVEDGSYFRNKSLIFGYTFSRSQLQRLKLEKLRVYLQALNLFTITNYTGLDPELSGTSAAFGIDFGNYPNNERQFLLGISLNF
jgi:hypothetical protein